MGAVQIGGLLLTVVLQDSPVSVDAVWVLWAWPILGVACAVPLLAVQRLRPFGWAVALGAVEGFLALMTFILALFVACDCWD